VKTYTIIGGVNGAEYRNAEIIPLADNRTAWLGTLLAG
jgi:Mg/Co/Ni transporter MgtE